MLKTFNSLNSAALGPSKITGKSFTQRAPDLRIKLVCPIIIRIYRAHAKPQLISVSRYNPSPF